MDTCLIRSVNFMLNGLIKRTNATRKEEEEKGNE